MLCFQRSDKTGSFHCQPDSDRTRPTRTVDNFEQIESLVYSARKISRKCIVRVLKVIGQDYRDVMLKTNAGLLPDISKVTEYFIFQQDSAPAHMARDTVELMQTETPDFI